MKPRLHFISLPHVALGTPTTCLCAYSARSEKFVKMLGKQYEIFMYAPAGRELEDATLVPCLSDERRQEIFGADEPNRLPAWPTDEQSREFNANVIRELLARIEPHDLILLSGGWTHKPIHDAFPAHIRLEPGVGYSGILPNTFCAFESWAQLNHVYAKKNINDVRFYDRVIPNAFDPTEFPILSDRKGEYLLFVGRLIARKGPHVAAQIAKVCGLPLYVAGAGGKIELNGARSGSTQSGQITVYKDSKIVGQDISLEGNVHYVGPVGIEERAKWMAGARAILVPTLYCPAPFEGVAVEANFAGCPAITTNQGAFTETIKHGVNGYRFDTLRQAVDAVEDCKNLNPADIRARAIQRYSLEAIAPKFDKWFTQLGELWGDGWNSL